MSDMYNSQKQENELRVDIEGKEVLRGNDQPQGNFENIKKKNSKKILVAIAAVLVVAIVVFFATADSRAYSNAMKLKDSGNYEEAQVIFEELDDYKDSAKQKNECHKYLVYEHGKQSMDNGDYEAAVSDFASLNNFEDSKDLHLECLYQLGNQLLNNNDYENASSHFYECKNYKDSKELYGKCKYEVGKMYLEEKDYQKAIECLKDVDYKDSQEILDNIENGKHSLNAFIERYNKTAEISESADISLGKLSPNCTNPITTSIGAEIKLNNFTDDEENYKYEINSFLWVKKGWILTDTDVLISDMCCTASGLLPDVSYDKILKNIAAAMENGTDQMAGYGRVEVDGYKYTVARTKSEVNFSIVPVD